MVKGGALALRAGLVIAATVGLAVMLAVLLASLKFERKLLDVTTSRLAVVAEEVRRRAEYGLTLGLDLAELEDLGAVVVRAATQWDEIDAVSIVGENGRVLFSSDPGPGGRLDGIVWTGGAGAEAGVRHAVIGDRLTIGVPVRNSFGQLVGEVVLGASLAPMRRSVAAVNGDVLTTTASAVGAAALVALLAVFLTIRRSMRGGGAGDGAALGTNADALLRTVEPRIAAAVRAAEREIAAAERAVERLDRAVPAGRA